MILLAVVVTAGAASAQGMLRGQVLDDNYEPINGASVAIAGMNVGTTTDASGHYALNLPGGLQPTAIVVFSFVGMETFETRWNNQATIDAQLFSAVLNVGEVVVTGLGNLNVNEYVGAHTSLKMDSLLNPSMMSVDEMLVGQVAGMMVKSPSMRAGAGSSITIRGQSTLLGTTEPLWVVDGIIQPGVEASSAFSNNLTDTEMDEYIGSAISWLNPQDVETVTVLKDASATAIYGSQASNGVIVITTKRGTANKLSVRANYNVSVGQKLNYGLYSLMNSQERINFSKEAFEQGVYYQDIPILQMYTYEGMYNMFLNGRLSESQFAEQYKYLETVNTDWFDLLTRPSVNQSANLSASGGSDDVRYIVSASYNDDKGVEKGNDSKRFTGRVGVDIRLAPKVRLNTSLMGSMSKTTGFAKSGIDPIGYATTTSRAIPAFNADGTLAFYQMNEEYLYNGETTLNGLPYNILSDRANAASKIENPSMQANLDFQWDITPDLTYQMVAGYVSSSRMNEAWMGEDSYYVLQNYRGYRMGTPEAERETYRNAAILKNGGILVTDHLMSTSYNVRNQLNYTREFRDGDHRLTAMAMWEVRSTRRNSKYNTVYGYDRMRGERVNSPTPPKEIVVVPGGSHTAPTDYSDTFLKGGSWLSGDYRDNKTSLAAIVAYTMYGKYVLNANMRNDWSNAFGQNANRRFNPAWSVGVSWRLGDEAFMEGTHDWLSQANFRLTYGTQGNVANSRTSEMVLSYNNVHPIYDEPTSAINSIANPYLTWERTQSWNAGLDLGLFDNRVSMVLDGYRRLSNVGRLFNETPENGGFSAMLMGTYIRNTGIEGTINFTPVQTERWNVSLSANAGKNWSKIVREDITDAAGYNIDRYIAGQNENTIMKGYPAGAFWAYPYRRPDPVTGIPTFYNFHEGGYNEAERNRETVDLLRYMGSKLSDITAGLTLRASYKNVTLTSQFTATLGGKSFLPNPYDVFPNGKMPEPTANLNDELLDRWTPTNTTSTIPGLYIVPDETAMPLVLEDPTSANGSSKSRYTMWGQSQVRVASLSSLRCQTIRLAWRVDPKRVNFLRNSGLGNVDLTAAVNNVFLLADSKWEGMDPDMGGDRKMPRSFTFGINLGF